MSTDIEDRLVAALAARAETVQPYDLRDEGPPTSRRPLHQRPSTWLLAAAACLAVVAVPLAVMAGQGDEGSLPPAPVTQVPDYSRLPDSPEGPGADWPEVGRPSTRYDVDGDGAQDVVVLRNPTGRQFYVGRWRIEVRLAAGGVSGLVVDRGGAEIDVSGRVDVDGNGDDEVLYYDGADDSGHETGVLDLTPDGLVDLRIPDDPGLTSQYSASGQLRNHWADDAGLWSTVSHLDGFAQGDDSTPLPVVYAVDLYRWTMQDDALVPVAQGERCVQGGHETEPYDCDAASVTALPAFFPEVTDSVPVGRKVTVGFEQEIVDLELVGAPGEVAADGDVELRVDFLGQQYVAPVPAGGAPRVYLTLVRGDAPSVLVRQGTDDPTYTVFRVQGGDLVALEPTGDPDASLEAGTTWISIGTQLFTREPLGDDAYRVWTWTPTADGLVASPSDDDGDNRVCFDLSSDPVTWTLC